MAIEPFVQEAILGYFCNGYNYMEMIELLPTQYRYNISLLSLKNWLKKHSIYKRPLHNRRDIKEVVRQAITDELNGTGSTMGYRRMHKALLNKGIMYRRKDVRIILKKYRS